MSSSNLKTFFSTPSQSRERIGQQIEFEDPIVALQLLFDILEIYTIITGEEDTILRFESPPLSHTLRITGSIYSPEIYFLRDKESLSQKFVINTIEQLEDVVQHVLEIQQEEEKNEYSGFLRPKPRSDQELLKILRKGDFGNFPHFAEAQRAISDKRYLDASVEVFSPFGLLPMEFDRSLVIFEDRYLKCVGNDRLLPSNKSGVQIWRGSSFLPDDTPLKLRTALLVTGLHSSRLPQLMDDMERRLPFCLSKHGIYAGDLEGVPMEGLVFDLSEEGELIAFVKRVLAQRDRLRSDMQPFGESRWLGKQKTQTIQVGGRPLESRRPYAAKYWDRVMTRQKSGLRNTVAPEDVVVMGEGIKKKTSHFIPKGKEDLRVRILRRNHEIMLIHMNEKNKEEERENSQQEATATQMPLIEPLEPDLDLDSELDSELDAELDSLLNEELDSELGA